MEDKKESAWQRFCPLIPMFKRSEPAHHSPAGFWFKWLFFEVWDLPAFEFELSVFAFHHHGFGVRVQLPYLIIKLAIPFPGETWFYFWNKTNRFKN
jgi:hypothetical protein